MDIDRFRSRDAGRLVETWYEDKPYLAFVPHPLPPKLHLDNELLLALSEADRALGELAGLGRSSPGIPNPRLLISPFIRREAVLSSMIEGTQTGLADLYAYEAGQLPLPGINPAPLEADRREVLNYVRALEYGLEHSEDTQIDLNLIRAIHKILMKAASSRHSRPGEFRTQQNWIGGESIRSAVFVPPPVPRMEKALADLETYLQAPHEAPPLLRLAFIHYQFEAIHPFVDGNGRTGRLLIVLLLVHWGLLPLPLLYLSAFFEKRRRDYFELLLAVSERGVWREWCRFFLEGVAEQAKDAIARAKQLQDLQLDWHIRLTRMRVSATLLILADTLFDIPFITVPEAQKRLGTPSYNTARRGIQKLVDAGILQPPEEEQYNKLFVAKEIINLFVE